MKLAPKTTLVLVAAMTVVMSAYAVSSIAEHRAQLQEDTRVDNTIMARTLADGIAAVYRHGGEQAARDLVAAVDRNNPEMGFAWFTPAGDVVGQTSGPAWAPSVPTVEHSAVVLGEGGRALGRVSVVDSLADEHDIVRRRIVHELAATMMMAIVAAIVVVLLGRKYITAPVRALSAKAARIGRGDFSGPLRVRGDDELAGLARNMNAMADELADTRVRMRDESTARIVALEQLRHAERLGTVGKLAAGIAHELGTPLNVVDARAQMIQSGDVSPDDVPAFAGMIREQTARMTAVIRQLLGFARMQPKRAERRDVRALVAEVRDLVEPLARRRGVTVTLAPGPSRFAEVDPRQLEQVFANIVMNAIQACSSGGSVHITVDDDVAILPAETAAAPHGLVCIAIHDDGSGIAPADLLRVFEPFFTTKEVGQGTGLGLSVAYGIVREHGGFIDARSDLGEGSTFIVHLPKAPPR